MLDRFEAFTRSERDDIAEGLELLAKAEEREIKKREKIGTAANTGVRRGIVGRIRELAREALT